MQALACGLPLISTTNTGGEDLLSMSGQSVDTSNLGIKQFPAGFLIPIHSPEAISYCLKRLAFEAGLWIKMRNESLKLASTKLSWGEYAARARDQYKLLIDSAK